ncbi:hypothetical protein [Haloprofundus salinisoli]|uniref:hypothetical protein n=1 Tax=Haloprofundus salinisoli TaxID=2876193 RepID=UPI001CCE167C|nr:hypothetical protein [Haloprofundus salinisoli]
MSSPTDHSDEDSPPGWTPEENDDDVRSWLGADERVVCAREDDGWTAYAVPRSELGASHRTPLTDESTDFDGALSAARDYMERNDDAA